MIFKCALLISGRSKKWIFTILKAINIDKNMLANTGSKDTPLEILKLDLVNDHNV